MPRTSEKPRLNIPLMVLFLGVGALVVYTILIPRVEQPGEPVLRQPMKAPGQGPRQNDSEPVLVVSAPTSTPAMSVRPVPEARRPDENTEPQTADDDFAKGWAYRSVVGNIIELDFRDWGTKDVRLGEPFNAPDGERAVVVEIEHDLETVIVERVADGRRFRVPKAEPGPTEEEMAKMLAPDLAWMKRTVERFAPGWKIAYCGDDVRPGLQDEWGGRKNVLVTHPLDQSTGCILFARQHIPARRKTTLRLTVGHDPRGDWDLIVRADGKELLRQAIGATTVTGGWLDVSVNLTQFAGRWVKLEVVNQPSGWYWETGYWAKISIGSE